MEIRVLSTFPLIYRRFYFSTSTIIVDLSKHIAWSALLHTFRIATQYDNIHNRPLPLTMMRFLREMYVWHLFETTAIYSSSLAHIRIDIDICSILFCGLVIGEIVTLHSIQSKLLQINENVYVCGCVFFFGGNRISIWIFYISRFHQRVS